MNEETPETMARGEMPTGENVPHERCPRQPLATERLDAETVGEAVYDAIRQCAVTLRPDFRKAVEAAREEAAPESREAGVLDRILENARIGATDGVPICQDTGSGWVCLEVGESLAVPGNIFSRVNDAVARAYTDGRLRMSLQAGESAQKIAFLHYPPVYPGGCAQPLVDILHEFGVQQCYYGHLHGKSIRGAIQREVDGIRYKLVSADGLHFCPYKICD